MESNYQTFIYTEQIFQGLLHETHNKYGVLYMFTTNTWEFRRQVVLY